MTDQEPAGGAVMGVSEVTARLKRLIEGGPLHTVSVRGEISGWRLYPSGHAYFALKDAGAQLQCVMFKSALARCRAAGGLRDGLDCVFSGELEVYAPHGKYQLVARRAEPAGKGSLAAEFEKLKARLAAEGLFGAERKRPLPFLPRRIGIVTSPAGAVVHDMATVLLRRYPNLEIRLYPVKVQGEGAAAEIARGVEWFNAAERDWRPDVLIVGRGGGSIEDLWAFNEEIVVRAVAASAVPVVSAVGHETDFTLCDFAADVRAGTPSIAAEICVPVKSELKARVDAAASRLDRCMEHAWETRAQRLDSAAARLGAAMRAPAAKAAGWIRAAVPRMSAALKAAAAARADALAARRAGLSAAARAGLSAAAARLGAAEGRLRILGPESAFGRGWSLTTGADGRVLRAACAKPGDRIFTRMADGTVVSTVESAAPRAAAEEEARPAPADAETGS